MFELIVEYIKFFIDIFLHLDTHLGGVIEKYGVWTYGILTLTIFCETGLVVTPFLPGDSLLFAAGAFAASGSLEISLLFLFLFFAAVLGDAVNYSIGSWIGPKALTGSPRFIKKEYLERTQKFYERYGGKTIVFARFFPIIRTFAPFLAGVGKMRYARFFVFNVFGAFLWIIFFLGGG